MLDLLGLPSKLVEVRTFIEGDIEVIRVSTTDGPCVSPETTLPLRGMRQWTGQDVVERTITRSCRSHDAGRYDAGAVEFPDLDASKVSDRCPSPVILVTPEHLRCLEGMGANHRKITRSEQVVVLGGDAVDRPDFTDWPDQAATTHESRTCEIPTVFTETV